MVYRLKTTLIRARPIILKVPSKKGTSEFETGMQYFYKCYDRLNDEEVATIVRTVKTADYDWEAKKRIYYYWAEEKVRVLYGEDMQLKFDWLKSQKKFGDVLKKTNEVLFGENRYVDDKDISYVDTLKNLEFMQPKQ